MDFKQIAGETAAIKFIESGMVVGLGTGSTTRFAILKIGERIKNKELAIRGGIPTSRGSEELAKSAGIPLLSLGEISYVDVTIDGADEIDEQFRLIKGGGGALLREKMVASITKKEVIVVDPAKIVKTLGKEFPLPVEIVRFGWEHLQKCLAKLECEPKLRFKDGKPFITDNGNYIIDCKFQGIADPEKINAELDRIPGVVENGLFIGLTHVVVVGTDPGAKIFDKPGPDIFRNV